MWKLIYVWCGKRITQWSILHCHSQLISVTIGECDVMSPWDSLYSPWGLVFWGTKRCSKISEATPAYNSTWRPKDTAWCWSDSAELGFLKDRVVPALMGEPYGTRDGTGVNLKHLNPCTILQHHLECLNWTIGSFQASLVKLLGLYFLTPF